MSNKTTTRLGTILLNKGLLTTEQLTTALMEQQTRRQRLDPHNTTAHTDTSLGEILIELGFIDRLQLNRGLNWQAILRKMTLAMALCAPFMTLSYRAAASTSFPLTIEAENYTTMVGMQTEPSSDIGGGLMLGYIDATDKLSYENISVDIPVAGNYTFTYRVATATAGSFSLYAIGSNIAFDTVSVPNTGGWATWVDIKRTINLPAGTHKFGITVLSGKFKFNWFKIESLSTPLPLTIEAENYSSMTGMQTEPSSDIGGGLMLGYIDANDSLHYENTPVVTATPASYTFTYRVATASGGTFALYEEGSTTPYDTIVIPNTGGWATWVDIKRTINLPAGSHKFAITVLSGKFKFNWFKIDNAPPSSSSSSSSGINSSSISSNSSIASPPISITIQAENFSSMLGVQNEPSTDTGGGLMVGYIDPTDKLLYENNSVVIPQAGSYSFTYRVASAVGGSFFLHEVGSTAPYDTVVVPNTGDWAAWVDIKRTINLPAGTHKFGITILSGKFKFNWFKIETAATPSSSISTSATNISTASSKPNSSSSSSIQSPQSSSTSSKATSSSNAVVSTQVAGPVGMNWTAPNLRANGAYLDITEIGGYEIRYKLVTDTNFTYITINDAWQNYYNFAWLEGNYVFQLAAFDKKGVYSKFVDVISTN